MVITWQFQRTTNSLLPSSLKISSSTQQKVPITAIVVCFNEAKHLRESLASLAFCDEIIVADLGSSDNSLEIGRSFTDFVLSIPRVPFVEMALEKLVGLAHNDWIISQDPDEVMSAVLAKQLQEVIDHEHDLARLFTPIRYYFKGKPLKGTIWGEKKYKGKVFNRKRTLVSPLVHVGINILPGFTTYRIPIAEDNFIEHYWMDSYKSLFQKHWRYVKGEGESRFKKGNRFSLLRLVRQTFYAFFDNFFKYNSIADGKDGVFLALFYTWYVVMSELSLLKYQLGNKK